MSLSARKQAIVRLLETRDDELPLPGKAATVASGFSHEARTRTCPDCLANGRVSVGCETCHGRGFVDPRYATIAATDALPDDGERRDPYSVNAEAKRYGLDGSRHDAAYRRDREIESLARQTRPALSEAEMLEEANHNPFGWERARAQMWHRFDYAALDLALDELRNHDPVAYRALHAVYVYGWLREVSGAAEAACARGLAFLSPRLAAFEFARGRQLRVPGVEQKRLNLAARGRGADERALAQRDEEIRRAVLDVGIPVVAVARTWSLSVSQVNRIVSRAA